MIDRTGVYVGLAACLVCAVVGVTATREKVLFEGKSEFNSSIKVVEDAEGLRTLIFDNNGAKQSTVKLGNPDRLEL